MVEQIWKRNFNVNDDGETDIPHVSYFLNNGRMEEHLDELKKSKKCISRKS